MLSAVSYVSHIIIHLPIYCTLLCTNPLDNNSNHHSMENTGSEARYKYTSNVSHLPELDKSLIHLILCYK